MPGKRWLALLGWRSTALHLGTCGRWIDKSPRERLLCLSLVAN